MPHQDLTESLIQEALLEASKSPRKRHAVILHEQGSYFNEVFNFICRDSYMQPHLHPGLEKNEVIRVLKGSLAVVLFDEQGMLTKRVILTSRDNDEIVIPAFTWHTYVMLEDNVITYETMNGVYHIDTWKHLAQWAPAENSIESIEYLKFLKEIVS